MRGRLGEQALVSMKKAQVASPQHCNVLVGVDASQVGFVHLCHAIRARDGDLSRGGGADDVKVCHNVSLPNARCECWYISSPHLNEQLALTWHAACKCLRDGAETAHRSRPRASHCEKMRCKPHLVVPHYPRAGTLSDLFHVHRKPSRPLDKG